MGIRLMELKIDAEDRHEFLLKESISEEVLNWEYLLDVEEAKKYMEEDPFPQDKLYSKEDFLYDVEKAMGYIHLLVENIETAEYIQEMIYELI